MRFGNSFNFLLGWMKYYVMGMHNTVKLFCVFVHFGRLGGGIFGDTHLAKWKEMTVAVKRLTLLVHENQITPEAMKLMKNEVWFLRWAECEVNFFFLPLAVKQYAAGLCVSKTETVWWSWTVGCYIYLSNWVTGSFFLFADLSPVCFLWCSLYKRL